MNSLQWTGRCQRPLPRMQHTGKARTQGYCGESPPFGASNARTQPTELLLPVSDAINPFLRSFSPSGGRQSDRRSEPRKGIETAAEPLPQRSTREDLCRGTLGGPGRSMQLAAQPPQDPSAATVSPLASFPQGSTLFAPSQPSATTEQDVCSYYHTSNSSLEHSFFCPP